MNAWSHLPNAVHIDRILASVKSQPESWDQAIDQVFYRARGQVCYQAWDRARAEQVWDPAREQVWDQIWKQTWNEARDQAWDQGRSALLALITYDDCAKYLELSVDQLKMLYQLSEHPACILLQPAVLVFEKERELA